MKKILKVLMICSIFCFSYNTASAQSYYNSSSQGMGIKCSGTTAAGYNCSRNAKSGSNYCSQHGTKNVNDNGYRYTSTCSAIAKSTGVQCRNKAKNGGMYCGRHD